MTTYTTDGDIARLATRVLDTTLPRGEWTHTAHFALALWTLRHRPDLADPARFRTLIVELNEAHGTANTDSSGYHHTITVASLRAAAACLAGHRRETPLARILAELVAGPFGRSDWILAHWSRETLFGARARRGWVPPDLLPLPF